MTDRVLEIASAAGVYPMQPGDVLNSPRGEPMHRQPTLLLPGHEAFVFTLKGSAIGVIILRPSGSELRYFDHEGIVHTEQMGVNSPADCMDRGIRRMCELIGKFLGERHPLAEVASANKLPA